LSQFKKFHPSGNLKFNYLDILPSLKLHILMEKILSISLKLNFTLNSLGGYELSKNKRITVMNFSEEPSCTSNIDCLYTYRGLSYPCRKYTSKGWHRFGPRSSLYQSPPTFIKNGLRSPRQQLSVQFTPNLPLSMHTC